MQETASTFATWSKTSLANFACALRCTRSACATTRVCFRVLASTRKRLGEGEILGLDVINRKVTVRLEDQNSETFRVADVEVIVAHKREDTVDALRRRRSQSSNNSRE